MGKRQKNVKTMDAYIGKVVSILLSLFLFYLFTSYNFTSFVYLHVLKETPPLSLTIPE